MQTREIPHGEWLTYFNDLTGRFRGIPTTVEVLSPEIGDQIDAADLPLVGISDDPKAEGGERITIVLANRSPTEDYSRTVPHPKRVMVEVSEDGLHEAVEIESDDGFRTLVRIGMPAVTPIR